MNKDPKEINHFASLSSEWWDPSGPFSTLHSINPVRIEYINKKAPLSEKKACDVGCGGGLLAEAMAKKGAEVTGLDLCEPALNAAKLHNEKSKLNLNYKLIPVEELSKQHPGTFDTVTCLEMLEHVPDPCAIVSACSALVKPGGDVFFSTINRTLKAWGSSILAAEYILSILPKNTHDYNRFIRPAILASYIRKAGLQCMDIIGLKYNPITKQSKLTDDVSVNYIIHAKKPVI